MGPEHLKRDFVKEAIDGEQAELIRALVLLNGAQASFQILHLSAIVHLS